MGTLGGARLVRGVGYTLPFYLWFCENLVLCLKPGVPPAGVASPPSIVAAAVAIALAIALAGRLDDPSRRAQLLVKLRFWLFSCNVVLFAVVMLLQKGGSETISCVLGPNDLVYGLAPPAVIVAVLTYSLTVLFAELTSEVST